MLTYSELQINKTKNINISTNAIVHDPIHTLFLKHMNCSFVIEMGLRCGA